MSLVELIFIGVGGVAVSSLASVIVRKNAIRYGVVDQPKGGRKIHDRPIAMWGGLGIAISIVVCILSFLPITTPIVGFVCGIFVLLIGGMLDDMFDLHPKIQILFPMAASIIVVATGTHIVSITNWSDGSALYLPWTALPTIVWMLIVTYATKLMDGIDGLVTGQVVIGCFLIAALAMGKFFQPEVAVLAVIVGGAYLGFLPFNFHPAKHFLGESGSTIAGFCLGFLSIVGSAKLATGLMALGLPLVDASLVITGRMLRGVSPFRGDKTHLHFKLLDAGLSQRQVVMVMWGLSLLCGLAALSLQTRGKIALLAFLVVATAGLSFIAGKFARKPST
ncbi:undecaprenyl/decaprenyl-phosphate alpha-N-acetylglucosaminyl 1-phosphate transferase [Candidatus Uhrbacteria bacterium]|nr:undecaprenyl/decaprenyl-phosphate alpha-N-acetylglucosaminyl 1-phosphate transferase [Candidatus Uhrbacteria bacterium]